MMLTRGMAVVWAATMLAGPASAATVVDIELSLVVDVSASVDSDEFELQKTGYRDAFNSAATRRRIAALPDGVAVNMIFFNTDATQVIDWHRLTDDASIDTFIGQIGALNQTTSGSTNIAEGIDLAVDGLQNNDFAGATWLIDVSADGKQNRSRDGSAGVPEESDPDQTDGIEIVRAARGDALAAGVDRINGLAITDAVADLADYFSANVIGGNGAFVLDATFANFANAIDQKIVAEVSPPTVIPAPTAAMAGLTGLALMAARRRRGVSA